MKHLFLINLCIFLISCSSNEPKISEKSNKSIILGIKGEEIFLRKGPGENFDKVVNQKLLIF
jgi:hypothetical protein